MLLWEDDIIVPSNAFNYMSRFLQISDVMGVTGVNYTRNIGWDKDVLLAWDWKINKDNNLEPVEKDMNEEKSTGFDYIGATATGFFLFKKEFLDTFTFHTKKWWGQDMMVGYHMNGYDKNPKSITNKLILCWEMKYPHLSMSNDNKFSIIRSPLCKTLVVDKYGTKF